MTNAAIPAAAMLLRAALVALIYMAFDEPLLEPAGPIPPIMTMPVVAAIAGCCRSIQTWQAGRSMLGVLPGFVTIR